MPLTFSAATRLAPLAVILAAAAGVALARPAPITAMDQEQTRLDQAAPVPRGTVTLRQTFIAAHNGLSAVELLAVVHSGAPPTATLSLSLLDANIEVLATQVFSRVVHNAPLRLTFEPVPDSAGKTYTLALKGSADNNTTAWAYSLDGYARGQLTASDSPLGGDFRFSTTYTYLWMDWVRDVARYTGRLAVLALPLWAVLFAPGLLLLRWLGPVEGNVWVRWGLALGLSLSLLPLAWLWITVVGLRWSGLTLGLVYIGIGLAVLWLSAAQVLRTYAAQRQPGIKPVWIDGFGGGRDVPPERLYAVNTFGKPRMPMVSRHDWLVALVLFASLAVRLLAARDLAFPAWVDSSHHFIIARLLAETGRVPASYYPLMPVDSFSYHFGFHALTVTLHWLTGLSLIDVFLLVGQALNGLMPLAVYAGAAWLLGRHRPGLIAAFFVGLVSLFPAYYLSWGRYTQLTGLLILAPLLGSVWRLTAPVSDGAAMKASFKPAFLVSLLAAGLLLTHYRLWAFFAVFVLMALVAGGRGGWRGVLMAAVIGALLSLPWSAHLGLVNVGPVLPDIQRLASPANYNRFPVEYFQRELEKGWMALALLGIAWGMLRRERGIWLVAGWVALTFALLNIGPGTWVVNNNSWAITLFLPGAFVLGWLAEAGVDWAEKAIRATSSAQPEEESLTTSDRDRQVGPSLMWVRSLMSWASLMLIAGLIAYAGVKGIAAQVSIANAATILARADDVPALQWVDQNTPSDAVFWVSGWQWLNNIWASSDGGSWIWPLTGRRTTLPPLDYSSQAGWRETVRTFNEQAAKIQDASTPETLALLRSAGVTHVYIGARGGNLKPEMFVNSPHYRLLYTNGACWVFKVIGSANP